LVRRLGTKRRAWGWIASRRWSCWRTTKLSFDRPIWSVEKDEATIGLYDVPAYPQDVILVFGSERSGLPPGIVARSQAVVGIPIYGVNHSLPVAVAAGIVLSDWARRRYAPGTTIAGPRRRKAGGQ
jgi:tRNA G18 (ribose-2'-O)-methylase SpoU